MIKVVFINADGEIRHVVEPASDNQYEDGATNEEGLLQKHVAYDADMADLFANKVWSYESNDWIVRAERPSVHHNWTSSGWWFNENAMWSDVRNSRDIILIQSDWSQLPDAPLTAAKKAEWAAYRAALRDVPLTNADVTSLDDVVWPTQPED